jgi:hypothetical protein
MFHETSSVAETITVLAKAMKMPGIFIKNFSMKVQQLKNNTAEITRKV